MPDASMDATLNVLVAAGFGVAGMALSTAIFAGGSMPWYYVFTKTLSLFKFSLCTFFHLESPLLS